MRKKRNVRAKVRKKGKLKRATPMRELVITCVFDAPL